MSYLDEIQSQFEIDYQEAVDEWFAPYAFDAIA